MKKFIERYYGLFLVIALVIFHAAYSLPMNWLYLMMGTLLVTTELIQWRIQRRECSTGMIFKITSYQWIMSIGVAGFIIYWFVSGGSGILLWISIALVLCYQVLYTIRNRYYFYLISPDGIRGINDSLRINAVDIRNVHMDEGEIIVDTSRHTNHFEIERKRLASPDWNELVGMIRSHLAK